jgi:LacI family transcriptional regulator
MTNEKAAKITISDVARVAGVSVTTVSRVLNGEKYVREDKKQAVLKAAAKLEYQPNVYARSLAGDRSYLVGLLFDEAPRGEYLSGMQRGAMHRCKEAGLHVVVEHFDKLSSLDEIESFLTKLKLSGAILTPPACDNPILLAALHKKKVPTARISPNAEYPGMPSVKIDDYSAACQVTQHLISLGHKDIGCITGDLEHADSGDRLRGFRDTMAAARLVVNENWVQPGDYLFDPGLRAASLILDRADRPTAIFSSNDDMAAATIVIADKLNIKVPEELSVVGFDDFPLAAALSPALTTIRQPVEEMARIAASLLIDMQGGKDSDIKSPAVLDVEFIHRASTAPVSKK